MSKKNKPYLEKTWNPKQDKESVRFDSEFGYTTLDHLGRDKYKKIKTHSGRWKIVEIKYIGKTKNEKQLQPKN